LKTRERTKANSPRIDIIRFDVLFRHTVRCIRLTLETSLRFFAPSRRSRTEAITLFSYCSITLFFFPLSQCPPFARRVSEPSKEREREREREEREREKKCWAYSNHFEQFLVERVQRQIARIAAPLPAYLSATTIASRLVLVYTRLFCPCNRPSYTRAFAHTIICPRLVLKC